MALFIPYPTPGVLHSGEIDASEIEKVLDHIDEDRV
jgi:hypothetical protein